MEWKCTGWSTILSSLGTLLYQSRPKGSRRFGIPKRDRGIRPVDDRTYVPLEFNAWDAGYLVLAKSDSKAPLVTISATNLSGYTTAEWEYCCRRNTSCNRNPGFCRRECGRNGIP